MKEAICQEWGEGRGRYGRGYGGGWVGRPAKAASGNTVVQATTVLGASCLPKQPFSFKLLPDIPSLLTHSPELLYLHRCGNHRWQGWRGRGERG